MTSKEHQNRDHTAHKKIRELKNRIQNKNIVLAAKEKVRLLNSKIKFRHKTIFSDTHLLTLFIVHFFNKNELM